MKKTWLALATAGALVLPVGAGTAVADCGGSERVTIAAEDGFFPYAGIHEGELRGFSLDIVNAAFDAVDCDVSYEVMPYSRCVRDVQAGRQRGCLNTTGSADNRERYLFHARPLFRGRIQVFAHPDRGRGLAPEDFRTGTFAVVRGYTYIDSFDTDESITRITVESDLQTLALVSRGRADFAVVYEKVARFHIGMNADLIDPAPVPIHDLAEYDLFVSFTRTDPGGSRALADALDEGLRRIHADGTYIAIETAWDIWLSDGIRKGEPAPHWTPGG